MSDIIYTPKGPAFEYGEMALNHYKSCGHGCTYCYAPSTLKVKREVFCSTVTMSKDWHARTLKHAAKLERKGITGPVHLCFLSDAYQPIEREQGSTRKVLEAFHRHGIRTQILTKAGAWALERDGDLLRATNAKWGATLTTDIDAESIQWEPGAALPGERIRALRMAKDMGLSTWVSFEPVINPDAVLRMIDQTHGFVDEYKVGKLNHHDFARYIKWPAFREAVVHKLNTVGAKFIIKKALLEA